MNKEFVIVIEADNKRAHAAYTKGLADLDLIWAQLMAHAKVVDAASRAMKEAEDRAYVSERELYLRQHDEFEKAHERWLNASSLFRGPRPTRPFLPYPMPSFSFHRIDEKRLQYESIRSELKRMADLAGAAIGPYRMTEHQVAEMIGWEDGSRIDRIKSQMEPQG